MPMLWADMLGLQCTVEHSLIQMYSEIPLLRPPKIKTFDPLKTLFAKFR